jgi:hypothetical protein
MYWTTRHYSTGMWACPECERRAEERRRRELGLDDDEPL